MLTYQDDPSKHLTNTPGQTVQTSGFYMQPNPCPTCGRCPTCGQYKPQAQPQISTTWNQTIGGQCGVQANSK